MFPSKAERVVLDVGSRGDAAGCLGGLSRSGEPERCAGCFARG